MHHYSWVTPGFMQAQSRGTRLSVIDRLELGACAEIFVAFGSMDTLRIFSYAENGIPNSSRAIRDLNLTPKRYYQRLNELIDLDLITKTDRGYVYTPLGEIFAKLGLTLIDILRNKEKLELILSLDKSNVLSPAEREGVTHLLEENLPLNEILRPILKDKRGRDIEKIVSYEELVSRISEKMSSASESYYLASTYFDPIVAEKGIQLMKRGVKTKVLMSKATMGSKITKLKMLMSPKAMWSFVDTIRTLPNIGDLYREADIPFSFIVIDSKECIFEFPNVVEGDFTIAFSVSDKNVSGKFIGLFEGLWARSGSGSLELLNLLKKL